MDCQNEFLKIQSEMFETVANPVEDKKFGQIFAFKIRIFIRWPIHCGISCENKIIGRRNMKCVKLLQICLKTKDSKRILFFN